MFREHEVGSPMKAESGYPVVEDTVDEEHHQQTQRLCSWSCQIHNCTLALLVRCH